MSNSQYPSPTRERASLNVRFLERPHADNDTIDDRLQRMIAVAGCYGVDVGEACRVVPAVAAALSAGWDDDRVVDMFRRLRAGWPAGYDEAIAAGMAHEWRRERG